VREILKNFLRETWNLGWAAWNAPAEQAGDAIWALAAVAFQLFVVFVILRFMWRKLK